MKTIFKVMPFILGTQIACSHPGMYRLMGLADQSKIYLNSKDSLMASHVVGVSFSDKATQYFIRDSRLASDYVDFKSNGEGLDYVLTGLLGDVSTYRLTIADDSDADEAIRIVTFHGRPAPEKNIIPRNSTEFTCLQVEYDALKAEVDGIPKQNFQVLEYEKTNKTTIIMGKIKRFANPIIGFK